ncbi:hypothetical protein FOA52_004975 [Chlamydomonas sp. UWO 241]|nr:hypothetical protein FOA52_004975 [Chlamydomonas sp. UWO 241]
MTMTTHYDLSYDEEDALRVEAGYPLKNGMPGSMLPLNTVHATHRLRPNTAPATGRHGTLGAHGAHGATAGGMSRAQRTGRSYAALVLHLDRTGRLGPGLLKVTGRGAHGATEDVARPAAPPPELDPSPEAQAVRAAWAKSLRYRSEYQTCFGDKLSPPAGMDATVPRARPASAQVQGSFLRSGGGYGGGGGGGRNSSKYHIPSRPNVGNRHSQHCAVHNPAHHVSPSEAAGRFTGRPGGVSGQLHASYYPPSGVDGVDAAYADGAASASGAFYNPGSETYKSTSSHRSGGEGAGGEHAGGMYERSQEVVTDTDLAVSAPWSKLGHYAIAGSTGVKLVGGRYRAVPQRAGGGEASMLLPPGTKEARELAGYTDYYGPCGNEPSVYYGRKYDSPTRS